MQYKQDFSDTIPGSRPHSCPHQPDHLGGGDGRGGHGEGNDSNSIIIDHDLTWKVSPLVGAAAVRPVHKPRSAVRGERGDPEADLVQAALQPRRQPHVHPHRPLAQVDSGVGTCFVLGICNAGTLSGRCLRPPGPATWPTCW